MSADPAVVSFAVPMNAVPNAGSGAAAAVVPPWARGLFCLLATVPFVGAAAAVAMPAKPAVMADAVTHSPLAFEQYLVNLGPVPAVREVAGRFTFKNVGRETVHVTQLEPSCGCLNPRLEKRIYAPGELGTFHVRVQTASESAGPHEFTVKVHYEDMAAGKETVERPPVELGFKLVVPEKQVSLRPRALVFYQLGTEPTTQDVLVVDERGSDLDLTSVTSSSPLATVKAVGKDRQDGLVRHTLRVTVAGNVPRGRTRALISVRTSDPAYRVLQIPLLIQGPESAPLASAQQIEVEPPQVIFPASAGLLTQPRDVVVTGPAGTKFQVQSVDSLTPAVSAQVIGSKTDAVGRPQVTLRVFVSGPPSEKGVRDVLTLKTNDAAQPQVQIPVSIEGPVRQASGERVADEPALR